MKSSATAVHFDTLESRRLMAVVVPRGFAASTFATGLDLPTAAAFAPDGRLFVTQQTGDLRIIQGGQLLQSPALSLTVDSDGERGLLGVAFDPAFATNGFVYLHYTVPESVADGTGAHNRVARFTLVGDAISPESEVVLLDLPTLGPTNHNGGALHFGVDGKLLVAVGDNAIAENAPDLNSPLGKILRVNADGSVPSDNPFLAETSGINQYIYAKGLRNPFTFAVQPVTGRTYVNDVGQNSFEEINQLSPGADFGWPATEGPTRAAGVTAPIYSYPHPASGGGVSIIGGAFFPDGGYYFGDLSLGFIRRLNVANGKVTSFATGLPFITGMVGGPDNSLYVLQFGEAPNGEVLRISGAFNPFANTAPTAALSGPAQSFRYTAGKSVKYNFVGTDKQDKTLPLSAYSYSVQRIVSGGEPETLVTGSGVKSVSFKVPQDTAALGNDVQYRFSVTVIDSGGLSTTTSRTLSPLLRTLTLRPTLPRNVTLPAGTLLNLNGASVSPGAFTAIAGVSQTLTVPAIITSGGISYLFAGYSGAAKGDTEELAFSFPASNASLLIRYVLPIR